MVGDPGLGASARWVLAGLVASISPQGFAQDCTPERRAAAERGLQYAELAQAVYDCAGETCEAPSGWSAGGSWRDILLSEVDPYGKRPPEVRRLLERAALSNLIGSGFNARLFVREGETVLAFQGSDAPWEEAIDWVNNIANELRLRTPQYDAAVEVARIVQSKVTEDSKLIIVGHSLGGGLAQHAGAALRVPVVTFNTAGPNPDAVPEGAASFARDHFMNLVVEGEMIDWAYRTARSEGRDGGRLGPIVRLPPAVGDDGNLVDLHKMTSVGPALQRQVSPGCEHGEAALRATGATGTAAGRGAMGATREEPQGTPPLASIDLGGRWRSGKGALIEIRWAGAGWELRVLEAGHSGLYREYGTPPGGIVGKEYAEKRPNVWVGQQIFYRRDAATLELIAMLWTTAALVVDGPNTLRIHALDVGIDDEVNLTRVNGTSGTAAPDVPVGAGAQVEGR